MSKQREQESTAAAVQTHSDMVTLVTTPQWAEVLLQLQTARNSKNAAVVVLFNNGVPYIGNVIAFKACRK